MAAGSIKQYRCVYKLIARFQQETATILRIRLIHRSSLRILQKEKRYWKIFFKAFTLFLYRNNCYDNYIGTVSKIIKTFFNYLGNDRGLPIGNFHKQFRLATQILTPVVLEPWQLNFLITNDDFDNSLPVNLQRSKDIFVFGCTVGLRVSDLMNLKTEHVQDTRTGSYLNVITGKTGTPVKIPLPDYLLNIIRKYSKKKNRYLLPRVSCTNLNIHLKLIMEKAGWTYNLMKTRQRQGKAVELKNKHGECYRFCDHISTHTMRRTAITTLLIMGVPELMVRRISGHSPGSREFYKYVAIVQDYFNEEIKQAFNKIINLEKPGNKPSVL